MGEPPSAGGTLEAFEAWLRAGGATVPQDMLAAGLLQACGQQFAPLETRSEQTTRPIVHPLSRQGEPA